MASSKPPKAPANKTKAPAAAGGSAENGDDPFNVFESIEHATEGGTKRLSIERIYQRKTQLEHILLRPDTYIGSVEPVTQPMWVYDTELQRMTNREIKFVPGLYKIFDEIVVNAADNKQRDRSMTMIKIIINAEKGELSVWNNGKGIPVVHHQVEKMYVPELIFGTLLTSSNYDDSERKVTGGRNGYGAKLCNIFSKKFTVETSCREYKKSFKQTWKNNMGDTDKAVVSDCGDEDFTKVTFVPDLAKFGMDHLDKDTVDLMSRRAYDVAGSSKGVRVFLNGKKIDVKGFKDYVQLYTKEQTDEGGEALKVAYEQVNERWEVALTVSDKGFQQVSFVNSIATTKGGRHIDYVADQVVNKVIEHVKKQLKKTGMNIRPFQIKNHLWLFVNCLIENPTFDSQTKENMTLQAKSFGSKCELPEKFIKDGMKCGVVESVMQWVRFKQETDLNKKCHQTKHSKLKGIPKLEDANDAGTKNSQFCTLILTEGDSAKAQAMSGLAVVGRDHFGIFPLRGKVLNVREASHKQIMENAEINNIIKILGLQYKKDYRTPDDLKTLRYGKVMIMADQDQDGSHIKGLLINFFHHNWPALCRQRFIEEFITPIVKVKKGDREISFFSLPEYEEWKTNTDNWHTWKIKYYKGLGTSLSTEMKEYFSDMQRHRVSFRYSGEQDDAAIRLAFSKDLVDQRKDWLTTFMDDRKRRRAMGLSDIYLYQQDTTAVSYQDFINKELILFSNMDNERSIPSVMDGFKPGQRKVLFTCIKRNDKRDIKVAQLAGSVAEHSAYHHGEASLMSTIIGMAQNFVGSNNINVLLPLGMFGTRESGGKNAASPRYIFTMLNPVTRALFHPDDDAILKHLYDDNQKIEPDWYVPIIPMVLINGAEGIGTAWSTKVPNYNPREIVANLKRMIYGDDPQPMKPWYKGFKGQIDQLQPQRYVCSGEVAILNSTTVEITELPIRTWTQAFKESVLDPMLYGTEKTPQIITDYKEYSTDTTVKFVIRMSEENLLKAEEEGLHKFFKLQGFLQLSFMVLFDAEGCLRKYERVEDVMKEFFNVRLQKYDSRKQYMEGMLQALASKLSNQARFIMEKIEGKIKLENVKKKDIVEQLVRRGYDPDPVKKWKESQKEHEDAEANSTDADEGDENTATASVPKNLLEQRLTDFDYLVTMAMIKLSEEEKDKLLRDRDQKILELKTLQAKTTSQMWLEDLDHFLEALDKQEAKEAEEDLNSTTKQKGKSAKGAGGKGGKVAAPKRINLAEVMPSPNGRRVEPRIDASMKLRMEKADIAKENKGKGKVQSRGRPKKDDGNGEEDGDEDVPFIERVIKKKQRLSIEKGEPVPDANDLRRYFAPVSKSSKTNGASKASENGDASNGHNSDVELFDEDSPKTTATAPATKKAPTGTRKLFPMNSGGTSKTSAETSKAGDKKKAAAAPKEVFNISDDDDEDNETVGKKKRQNSESGSSIGSVNGDESRVSNVADIPPEPRQLPQRARKPVSYKFDLSGSEEEEGASDNEQKPDGKRKAAISSDDEDVFRVTDVDDDDDFKPTKKTTKPRSPAKSKPSPVKSKPAPSASAAAKKLMALAPAVSKPAAPAQTKRAPASKPVASKALATTSKPPRLKKSPAKRPISDSESENNVGDSFLEIEDSDDDYVKKPTTKKVAKKRLVNSDSDSDYHD